MDHSCSQGKIMQIERRGTEAKIKQLGSRSDEYLTVTSISLHHQNQEILLASYLNGEIKMFHEKYGKRLDLIYLVAYHSNSSLMIECVPSDAN